MIGMGQLVGDQSGVTPVVAIILMIGVTAVLAGVVGTFALDIGQSSVNPAATILINENENKEVIVNVDSTDRVSSLEVDAGDCDKRGEDLNAEVGERLTMDCSDVDPGDETTIQVTGTYDGIESVLTSYEYEGR